MSDDRRVVLASRNDAKVAELRRILADTAPDLVVLGASAFEDLPEIAETGATFAENAMLKARAVSEHTGLIAVADDSGLTVDALNGMPGILSARWAGHNKDDDANLALVLDQLRDVPDDRRSAAFRCAAAACRPGPPQQVEVQEGEVTGMLLREPRGSNGFGYDPIFVPDGFDVTTAQMSAEDKDAISHRGRALRALARAIATWFS